MHLGSRGRARIALAIALVLTALGGVARAQEEEIGPAPLQRTIVLTSPGVVFMNTDVVFRGRLKYSDPSTITGFRTINRRYELPWGTGSGFVVSPDGTIVTASHVVEVSKQEGRNYFANRIVLDTFEYSYQSPFEQYTVDNRFVNRLLQQCYEGSACRVDVEPIVSVYTAIDVAGTELPKGMPARLLTSTGFEETDVAVLKVAGDNLPTVPLAATASVESGDELAALGFAGSAQSLPTGVTEPTKLFGNVSNIRSEGTSELIEVDIDLEPGMSGGPVIDQNGEVVGLTSFGLLQQSGESGQSYLRTVDDIKLAMSDAGVSANRGAVDTNFQKAMDLYWGNHYTDAVPEFQRVLALYDGHPIAKKYLAESQAQAGGPNDVPLDSGGVPMWIIAAIAGVVVLAVIAVLVTRGRKPAVAGAPAGTVAPGTVAAVAPTAMAPAAAPAPATGPVPGATEPAPAPYVAPSATVPPTVTEPPAPAAPAPAPAPAEPVPAPAEPVPAPAEPAPVTAPVAGETPVTEPAAPATEARTCPNCGSSVPPGQMFCGSCGTKME